jgi:putative transposase
MNRAAKATPLTKPRSGGGLLFLRRKTPLPRRSVAYFYSGAHKPGSPWENGYCESFNSKMRDEFLNDEIFYSLKELRVLAERWRKHYNTVRPHSSLGYRPPAPEAWLTSTARQQGEPLATLPAPPAAISCIDLNPEIAALH